MWKGNRQYVASNVSLIRLYEKNPTRQECLKILFILQEDSYYLFLKVCPVGLRLLFKNSDEFEPRRILYGLHLMICFMNCGATFVDNVTTTTLPIKVLVSYPLPESKHTNLSECSVRESFVSLKILFPFKSRDGIPRC